LGEWVIDLLLSDVIAIVFHQAAADGAGDGGFESVANLASGTLKTETVSSGANDVVTRPPFLAHAFE
jgi:hypothetical protein